MTHGSDTPPPVPSLRRQPTGDHPAPIDPIWFHEWRRELSDVLKEMRRSAGESMTEVRQRLCGIEGRLQEGAASIDKHDQQLAAVIEGSVAIEARLDEVEKSSGIAVLRRIEALELDKLDRDKAASIAAALEAQAAKSPLRRIWSDAIGTAGRLIGGAIAAAAVGIVLWIVKLWVDAGAPGLAVPSP